MSKEVKFPVFADKQGNRLVFPGLYSSNEGDTVSWMFCRQICAALGLSEEKDRLVVQCAGGDICFPHVKAQAGHPGFAHGSGEVLLIGGPTFDAIAAEEAANTP